MENELRRLRSGQQGRKQRDLITYIFKVIRRFSPTPVQQWLISGERLSSLTSSICFRNYL
jgi:hypothetical protein